MSFIGQIAAVLRADTADFRNKLNDAGEAAEGLDKKLKKFGLGFGGVAALAKWFGETLDHARNLTGVLDENQAAAKRFAESTDGVKKVFMDISVQAMGFVNAAGEWWGRMVAVKMQGEEQVALQEQIAKQTEETLRAIDAQKKTGAELGAIRTKVRETEEKIAAEGMKQLDLTKQILFAELKVAETKAEMERAGITQVELARAELKHVEAKLALKKLEGDRAKEMADEREKEVDQHIKTQDKLASLQEQWDEEEMERLTDKYRLQREAAEQRTKDIASGKIGADEEIAALQKIGTSREQIIASVRAQGFAEEDILKILDKQTEQLQFQTTIKSKGRGDTDLSDRVLKDKIQNLRATIAEMDRDVLGRRYNSSMRAQLQKEVDFASDELGDRNRVRDLVGRFGENGAARFYGGQMDQFERLLKFVTPPGVQERTANGVEELNERLASIFPKRSRR